MPRRVNVPKQQKLQCGAQSLFPQPPDPTGHQRGKRDAASSRNIVDQMDPREYPPKNDVNQREREDSAFPAGVPNEQSPSLRVGFLPPAPHTNGKIENSSLGAQSQLGKVNESNSTWISNDENRHQNPIHARPHLPSPSQPHISPGQQYSMHPPPSYNHHDGNHESWHDWQNSQQHSQWHYQHPSPTSYHQHHSSQWWGQSYYDDHHSHNPHYSGQYHPNLHHMQSSHYPKNSAQHNSRDASLEHYPGYHEFMPPLDNSAAHNTNKQNRVNDDGGNKLGNHGKGPSDITRHVSEPSHTVTGGVCYYAHANPHSPAHSTPPQPLPHINTKNPVNFEVSLTKRSNSLKENDRRIPPAHPYNNIYPPLPPLPGWERKQNDSRNLAKYAADRELHQIVQQQNEVVDPIPVYGYSEAFKDRSWDDMVKLLMEFQHKNPGQDLEKERLEDENATHDVEDDELILRSWIREVRWVRRARATDEERSPKATRGRSEKTSNATPIDETPLPDCLTLTPQRIEDVTSINFPWRDDRSSWQKWLDDLLHFRAKNGGGDMNVPLKYAEYPSLGNFVNRQRTEYRKLLQGRSSSMTQNKIADLNRIGFLWSVREGGHTSWDTRYLELREYQMQNGHCNVPKLYKPNPSLGYWVNEQRFQYRRMVNNKPSYMTEAKVAHLNALGFVWSLRESKKPWDDWLTELREYKKIHGHVDVPLKYEKNIPLGAFVNNQRSEYRKLHKGEPSSMTPSKIKDLEEMGFHWSVRESRTPWTTRLKELKEFKKEFGHVNVPKNWKVNPNLSYWVDKQRQVSLSDETGYCIFSLESFQVFLLLDSHSLAIQIVWPSALSFD